MQFSEFSPLTGAETIGYSCFIQQRMISSEMRPRKREYMRHGEPLDGEKTVQIVHRIARVLHAFAQHGQGPLGITDLAHATGLPKSTTHRLVTALVNEHLLIQDEDSHKYALSLR